MKTTYRIFICFIFGMLLSVSTIANGQGAELKDPLKKPDVWKRLESDPKNDHLWQSYFGKDLFELTPEEGKNYHIWQAYLVQTKKKKELAEERALIKKYTSKNYLPQSAYLRKMMSNISKNFMLIEDYFDEEFAKVGGSYTFYEEKHPKGDFNRVLWIELQENELIKLRKQAEAKSGK
ncbi:MAG: hypothetical protein ACPGJS_09860 [Flammeovirgaceae bacterium]